MNELRDFSYGRYVRLTNNKVVQLVRAKRGKNACAIVLTEDNREARLAWDTLVEDMGRNYRPVSRAENGT